MSVKKYQVRTPRGRMDVVHSTRGPGLDRTITDVELKDQSLKGLVKTVREHTRGVSGPANVYRHDLASSAVQFGREGLFLQMKGLAHQLDESIGEPLNEAADRLRNGEDPETIQADLDERLTPNTQPRGVSPS